MQIAPRIKIRPFTMADYPVAVELWSTVEGLTLNESDTPDAIAAFLQRNPDLSAVALDDEKIIGAVLCGHNGRAGHLYHLAVAIPYHSQGIAQALVGHCLQKLAAANIPRCNIFVYATNDEGNRFWLRNGWSDPATWKVMQKVIGA